MSNEGGLIGIAYGVLLKLPDGMSRLRLQSTLCALRDELALLSGCDAEEIQNSFEDRAAMISASLTQSRHES